MGYSPWGLKESEMTEELKLFILHTRLYSKGFRGLSSFN